MSALGHIGAWDAALIVLVSVQGTAIAYLREPKWKALLLCFPIPFTAASLALGVPVGSTHVAGMGVMMGYTLLVWWLHVRAHWPIVGAIATAALGYVAAGSGLARVLPRTEAAFWIAAGLTFVAALSLHLTLPHKDEPGHQTPLPLALKLPIIAAVITGLVLIKQALMGFMTGFPMVGVVTAYEARRSLWTVWRHIPVIVMAAMCMMAAVRLTQDALGLGKALVVGWAVYLTVLIPLIRRMWRQAAAATST